MPWVLLDDGFHSNPKVLEVGNAGAGLYARALSYCGDHLTDGYVPMSWARTVAAPKLREQLVTAGLWAEDNGGYQIKDYLEVNPSRAEVEEMRAKKAEAGRKGAKKRWQTR
jgi:hypothetical protein